MKYKEYLCKTEDGYVLHTLPKHAWSGLIEVPDGANYAYKYHNHVGVQFLENEATTKHSCDLIWQRQSQPETINDQYAEIEKVRQAVKIKSGSDSDHMADAMSYGFTGIKQDAVNHPPHYTNGKVECIDALESATVGKTGIEAVCVANVIKYLWRYEDKNGIEDVRKAQWYLNRLLSAMGD